MVENKITFRNTLNEQLLFIKENTTVDEVIKEFWFSFYIHKNDIMDKTKQLLNLIKKFRKSKKINFDECYVEFKHDKILRGGFFTTIYINHLETGELLYRIIPHNATRDKNFRASVAFYDSENEFSEEIVFKSVNFLLKWFCRK